MQVLGYSGRRRYGSGEFGRARADRAKRFFAHATLFDALTSFCDLPEELPLNLLPLDGVGHDAAAALIVDGRVVGAASEERFNRRKHSIAIDGGTVLPHAAARHCLSLSPAPAGEILHVAYYCDLSLSMFSERISALEAALPADIRSRVLHANQIVYKHSVSNERVAEDVLSDLCELDRELRLHFVPHHVAHAASAFYSSGFEEAGVLTIDASGEKSSSIFALGGPDGLHVLEETLLPDSLGALYMLLTAFLGFSPIGGEYKVMGMAAYGDPTPFQRELEQLIRISDDGRWSTDALMRADFGANVRELLGPPVPRGAPVTKREMDIAAALQRRFEEAVLRQIAALRGRHRFNRLCLAGGCALNCVLAGKIARSGMFEEVYVFPASGDDGCSVGAAQHVYHALRGGRPSAVTTMSLGPSFSSAEVREALERYGARVSFRRAPQIVREVAALLADGKIVGWFQGRMEFGPRALGNRSILADPRDARMRDLVNGCVKRRESFRPFAPAITLEHAARIFDLRGVCASPFMQFAVPTWDHARHLVPAVVHHDGSARVQTVGWDEDHRFWSLLDAFGKITGAPVILNTSFNVRGEPIVCTPHDALRCFLATGIDVLAIEDYIVTKPDSSTLNL